MASFFCLCGPFYVMILRCPKNAAISHEVPQKSVLAARISEKTFENTKIRFFAPSDGWGYYRYRGTYTNKLFPRYFSHTAYRQNDSSIFSWLVGVLFSRTFFETRPIEPRRVNRYEMNEAIKRISSAINSSVSQLL